MLAGVPGVLALFATFLAIPTCLGVILFALITRRTRLAERAGLVLAAWIGVYAALLLLFSLTSRTRYLAIGQERCFDEMCFSVTGVTTSPTLGEAHAKGVFYIVSVQLHSEAKRTAQRPSQAELFVVDAQGRHYTQMFNAGDELGLPVGQPLTTAQVWDRKLQPGETLARTIAFDLPAGVEQPGLVLSEGIGPLGVIVIGDENSLLHQHVEVLLGP